jgi:hypothetical protein
VNVWQLFVLQLPQNPLLWHVLVFEQYVELHDVVAPGWHSPVHEPDPVHTFGQVCVVCQLPDALHVCES